MSDQAARDALDGLYRQLPRFECKGLCAEACGPVQMTRVEYDRIVERVAYEPSIAAGFVCPLLTSEGRCSVYDIRPLICRLYGLADGMRCEHGCRPARYLTKAEGYALLTEAGRIGA